MTDQATDLAEVAIVLDTWLAALRDSDGDTLQRLMHPSLIHTDPAGSVHSRESLAQVMASMPVVPFDEATSGDIRIVFHGRETAIATGYTRLRAVIHGQPTGGTFRFTDVLIREDGRWQLVATHTTLVQGSEPATPGRDEAT